MIAAFVCMSNQCKTCVCGASGGGGGWVRGVISYICHSTDVRAELPFFQRCQLYDWPPFFHQKVYA